MMSNYDETGNPDIFIEGETVCFRLSDHPGNTDSFKMVGEIVMLDTGTPLEPIKQRLGARQISAIKEKHGLDDTDVAKINECLDKRWA